jgi:hypothetical protein
VGFSASATVTQRAHREWKGSEASATAQMTLSSAGSPISLNLVPRPHAVLVIVLLPPTSSLPCSLPSSPLLSGSSSFADSRMNEATFWSSLIFLPNASMSFASFSSSSLDFFRAAR